MTRSSAPRRRLALASMLIPDLALAATGSFSTRCGVSRPMSDFSDLAKVYEHCFGKPRQAGTSH